MFLKTANDLKIKTIWTYGGHLHQIDDATLSSALDPWAFEMFKIYTIWKFHGPIFTHDVPFDHSFNVNSIKLGI